VIHAGLYYVPGSLKAQLCREGMEAVKRFANEHEIPYKLCGKLVVALDERELPRLAELKRRGVENGLKDSARSTPKKFASSSRTRQGSARSTCRRPGSSTSTASRSPMPTKSGRAAPTSCSEAAS
jgi:hypothetical protein